MNVHEDIETWFAIHPTGPCTDERQLLNDAADEIARLTERLAQAEARIIHTPSPEHWAEVQSQLASCKERLAASETYRHDLLDRLAKAEADVEVARDINKLEHDERLSSFQELQDLATCRALLREAVEMMHDDGDGWAENWAKRAQEVSGGK